VKVQVLGTGCPKCKRLVDNVRQAIEEADLDVEVEKVEDIKQIVAFGVMMMPALAVDGEVKSSGKVLSADHIKKLLEG
jgi:small redox-active disulfide protein 2